MGPGNERHFDDARRSHKGAKVGQIAFDGAPFRRGELAILDLLDGVVDLGGLELAMSEDDDAYSGGFATLR